MFQLTTRYTEKPIIRKQGTMEECIQYIRDKYITKKYKEQYDKYIEEGKFDLFLIALGLDLEEI